MAGKKPIPAHDVEMGGGSGGGVSGSTVRPLPRSASGTGRSLQGTDMRHALLHRGAVARAKSGSKTAKHGADAGRHTKKASLDGAKTSLKEAQKLHDVMVRGYNKAQAVVDKAGGLTKASTSQKRRLLVAERNMSMMDYEDDKKMHKGD